MAAAPRNPAGQDGMATAITRAKRVTIRKAPEKAGLSKEKKGGNIPSLIFRRSG